MKEFAALFLALDQSNKTNDKLAALTEYFNTAADDDKLWAIALLSHRRPKRPVNVTLLKQWATEIAEIPFWLFEESYAIVGDLSETISLLLPEKTGGQDETLSHWMREIIRMGSMQSDEEKRAVITGAWMSMDKEERFVFNKLMTGGFRIGVSQNLMVRALSTHTGLPVDVLAHRITGNWQASEITFSELMGGENAEALSSKPYPFYLAYPLEEDLQTLGEPQEWQAEHKWDGIRGQLIVRNGEIFLWSRGEELVTEKFPELHVLKDKLPDGTVIDGEIMCHNGQQPLPFALLQTRIGRKNLSKKIMEQAPVAIVAYDLLEYNGADLREVPLEERRKLLENLVEPISYPLLLSPTVTFDDWEQLAAIRARSREFFSEGLMLKRKSSPYRTGRKRGDWWKWKTDPMSIDAVMIYAQSGHGRRANLFTDYTFAVWDNGALVPFTKAYSGLTDKEILEVDNYVKKNTLEKFGPVRSVKPQLVFEIGFEGIQQSPRHRSGVALRFPRILRWRKDKPIEEANTLEDLKGILKAFGE